MWGGASTGRDSPQDGEGGADQGQDWGTSVCGARQQRAAGEKGGAQGPHLAKGAHKRCASDPAPSTPRPTPRAPAALTFRSRRHCSTAASHLRNRVASDIAALERGGREASDGSPSPSIFDSK